MRRALAWLMVAGVAFALVTWIALEGGTIGVLRTWDGAAWRTTHVWFAEGEAGSLWLEAATPERNWLLDLRHDPAVELDRDGATTRWRAVPVEGSEAHDNVREMLRAKYGWADRWVGLLQDTSRSVAVRLDPR